MARRLCAVAACALAISCGDGGKRQLRSADGDITLEPSVVDMGAVAIGKFNQRTVTVRNDGVAPLHIEAPAQLFDQSKGGDFSVSGLPLTLKSGQTAQVQVRFHPAGMGARTQEVPLATNSSVSPQVALSLAGQGVLGLAQLTADVIDFGDVVVGESASQTFSLVNNDKAITDVRLSPVAGAADLFSSDASQGAFTLKPDEQLLVTLRFKPVREGAFEGSLQVTPCPSCAPRAVRLTGNGALRVVDVNPSTIAFGDVVAGTSREEPVAFVNRSKQSITLQGPAIAGDSRVEIALDGGVKFPVTIPGGARISGSARFAPVTFGGRAGKLTFAASDGAAPVLAVEGFSYGSQLNSWPEAFKDFAAVIGTDRPTSLILTNTGLDPKSLRPLVITSATIEGTDAAMWSAALPPLPWTVGAPGDQGRIDLTFSPDSIGFGSATLVLQSNDMLHPTVSVKLGSLGRDLPPCNARLVPSPADFGNVSVGWAVTSGFEVVNDGGWDCIVGDPVLTSGGPQFHWPGNVQPRGRTIPPGGRVSIRVQFQPDAERDYAGQVELYISNKAAPKLTVPLTAHGDSGCFSVIPATLEFGGGRAGCGIPQQTATLRNYCQTDVTITGLDIPAPFGVVTARGSPPVGAPAVPFTLARGQTLDIPVRYAPQTAGDDVAMLQVSTSISPRPFTIGATGAAVEEDVRTDQWDQSTPKVDLLFVIDNSGSTAEEQQALAQNLDRLWNRIELAHADFHIAVTTTGMYAYTAGWAQCPGGSQGGEAGRFFPVDGTRPRLLTPQTPDVRNALIANMNVGQCHWDERFTEPVIAALTPPLSTSTAPGGNGGFLRDDARLALLAIADADDSADENNPPTVDKLVQTLRDVKHGALDLVSFAGIVALQPCATAEGVGYRYAEIAAALHGRLEDICNLGDMGNMLDRSLDSLLMPLTSFSLSAQPRYPDKIEVRVDGVATADFAYDPVSNRIVFPPTNVPPPGSQITAKYEVACP